MKKLLIILVSAALVGCATNAPKYTPAPPREKVVNVGYLKNGYRFSCYEINNSKIYGIKVSKSDGSSMSDYEIMLHMKDWSCDWEPTGMQNIWINGNRKHVVIIHTYGYSVKFEPSNLYFD